jgi:signal transduction histidine kinase
MKRPLLLIFLISVITAGYCQQKQIDSLRGLLKTAVGDTTRVNLLVKLSSLYYTERPDSGLTYASEALVIAKRINYKQGEIHALSQVGFSAWLLGNLPTALQTFVSSQNMAIELNDQWSIARNYDGMSCVYMQANELKLAVNYGFKSEAIFDKLHDYPNVVDELMDIEAFYSIWGKMDSTLFIGKKALALAIKINEVRWRSQILGGLGTAYCHLHQNKLGLSYLYAGLAFAEQHKQPYNLNTAYNLLALYYLDAGNRDSCIYFAKKEFDLAQSRSFYAQIATAAGLLAREYFGYDNLRAAHYYYISNKLKDSLFSADKAKQVLFINIAEQQHAADLKAAAKAYQSKLKLWATAIALILVVIILVIVWRNNKKQQKANKLLANQKQQIQDALQELKTTQNQLIQSEKMASLGELTAGIAHEIQNPLNFVNNFSEVNAEMLDELKAESTKPKTERNDQSEIDLINDLIENERKINHHGKRADAIVKGMLQHSQSGSGAKESVNMNALADEYLRLSYHGSRAKDKSFNAEMITDFDDKLPKVSAIPQDMGRVLLNLFNNAFYAVSQKQKTAGEDYKPTVCVTTSAENGCVMIKVKDNGIGIPDAIKDKIMQPFFTTKPTGEGTGLGLSLTYDMVVKGHGGSIAVDTKEGEYTIFTINLPLT